MKYLCLILLLLSACNHEQEQITKELNQKLKSAIEDLSKNPTQPIEEIKKLSQLEYKVITFNLETSPDKINDQLNDLGMDRWDCDTGFSRPRTPPTPPEIVIICKRTPETVLRFVPKSILGR